MFEGGKATLRTLLDATAYRRIGKYRYWLIPGIRATVRSGWSILCFLVDYRSSASLAQRFELLKKFRNVSKHVRCPHNTYDILTFVSHILKTGRERDGVFVEAGCFKGGS